MQQKDGLTSFLMLSVLEVKNFQYGFSRIEEHEVCINNHSSYKNEVAIMATKPESLVAKKEMLIAL